MSPSAEPIRHLAALRASAPGAALADAMARARAPVMLERSLRLSPGALAEDRFLLSVPARAAPAGLAALLAGWGMPAEALAAAEAGLPRAAFLHLGIEGAARMKLYLERPDGLAPDGSAGPPLHRAWKWRPADGACAEDTYSLVPPGEAAARLAALPAPLRPSVLALLDALGARPGALFLLDVLGEGRRSLDIRCYDFDRTLGDLTAPLLAAAAALGVPAATLEAALARHAAEVLGHVACGTGRDGQPFLTLYVGAEACPPEALAA